MNVNHWPNGIARTVAYPHDVSALRSSVLGLAIRGLLTNRAASVSGDTDTQRGLTYPAPTTWRRTNLGNIIKLVSGQHLLPSEYNTDPDGGGVPYVTGPSNFGRTGLIIERYALVRKAVATEGQLLLTVKGSGVGSTAWCDQPQVAISRQLMALEATGCTPGFLELLVREMASYLKERARSLIPGISRDDVLGFMVAVPAEDEQNEIIAKVREVTALCDELEVSQTKRDNTCDRLRSASLARLTAPTETPGRVAEKDVAFFLSHSSRMVTRPGHVADVRRALCELAVRGSLGTQSAEDRSSATLVEEALSRLAPRQRSVIRDLEAFPFSIPTSWTWSRLGAFVLSSDAGWSPSCETFPREGTSWGVLKVSAVSWEEFRPEENKQLLRGVEPKLAARVNNGDFLVSRANTAELVGKAVIVDTHPVNLMLSDKIVRLRFVDSCDQRYFLLVNNRATYAREYYAETASGTSPSMKNVSREAIYGLPIPIPPLEEQHRIVAKVDELMAICDELERSLEAVQAGRTRALEAVLHRVLEEAGAPLPALLEVAG